MKCKDCYNYGYPQRAYTDDAECVFQQWIAKEFDWQPFRAEAAKDILCAIIQGGYAESRIEYQSKLSVMYADELVKQLKEKKEK